MKATQKSNAGSILYQNTNLLEIFWAYGINIEISYEKNLVITWQFLLETDRPATSINGIDPLEIYLYVWTAR